MGLAPSSEPHASTLEIASLYPGLGLSQSNSYESPISVSTLRPSALDKIQEFLVRGERLKACHFAMDEKLWAHALLIASSVDKEMWKAVVNEFLRSELGRSPDTSYGSQLHTSESGARPLNGRESLRVAYSMFSGQGATCGAFLCFPFLYISHSSLNPVQELLPQIIPSRSLQVAGLSHATPVTANFLPSAASVPLESLSKWPEAVAMMLSSNMTIESSSALTALGDCLAHHRWMEAAHVW